MVCKYTTRDVGFAYPGFSLHRMQCYELTHVLKISLNQAEVWHLLQHRRQMCFLRFVLFYIYLYLRCVDT